MFDLKDGRKPYQSLTFWGGLMAAIAVYLQQTQVVPEGTTDALGNVVGQVSDLTIQVKAIAASLATFGTIFGFRKAQP